MPSGKGTRGKYPAEIRKGCQGKHPAEAMGRMHSDRIEAGSVEPSSAWYYEQS